MLNPRNRERSDVAPSARRLLSAAALLALLATSLVAPQPAHAEFTATLSGSTATLTGNDAGDRIIIDVDPIKGWLRHNRSSDPDFADSFDFDTVANGSQHLTAAMGVTVNINAGGGDDTIQIGSLVVSAFRTAVRFNINGGAGSDAVIYDDSTDNLMPRNILITNDQISIPLGASAGYTQAESLLVNASQITDTIAVQSTAAATPVVIDNPVANNSKIVDTVNVGAQGNTQNILGAVTITNQAAFTKLNADDSADPTGRTVTITDGATNGTITGLAPASLTYRQLDMQSVNVKGGNGGNTFNIASKNKLLPKSLISGGGNDTFVFANGATLTGAGVIDGGAGTNTLDYSAYTTSVNVDAGTATETGAIMNIENVTGGSGDDTLFGRDGVNSILKGGPGSDLLQGGSGDDTLIGGAGDDTLIGGAGDDRFIWNNGDGSDMIDGKAGAGDQVEVNGDATSGDAFTAGPNNGRVAFARANLAPFALDIGTTERLVVNGGGGDDSLIANSGLAEAGIAAITMNGDAGNDSIQASGDPVQGDVLNVVPNGARASVARANLVPFALDIGTTEQLTLNADGGDDTFNVIPLAATRIALDGGPHSAGDVLNFDRNGLPPPPPAPPGTGTISMPGRQPVTYTRIEKINIVNSGSTLFLPLIRR